MPEDGFGLEFSPCGKFLVAGKQTGFEVFDAKTGEVEFDYSLEDEWVAAIECTSDRDVWLTAQHAALRKGRPQPVTEFRRWTWPRSGRASSGTYRSCLTPSV